MITGENIPQKKFSYGKGDVSFNVSFTDDEQMTPKIKVFLDLMKEATEEMEEFLSTRK